MTGSIHAFCSVVWPHTLGGTLERAYHMSRNGFCHNGLEVHIFILYLLGNSISSGWWTLLSQVCTLPTALSPASLHGQLGTGVNPSAEMHVAGLPGPRGWRLSALSGGLSRWQRGSTGAQKWLFSCHAWHSLCSLQCVLELLWEYACGFQHLETISTSIRIATLVFSRNAVWSFSEIQYSFYFSNWSWSFHLAIWFHLCLSISKIPNPAASRQLPK